jgi:chromate transporter
VDGVTAAAIGAIASSVIVLGRRTLLSSDGSVEMLKLIILAITIVLLWKFKKLPEPVIVLAAAIVGLVVYPMVHRGP